MELLASNRKAKHDYYITNLVECGVVMTGKQVKACKTNKVGIVGAYCVLTESGVLAKGVNVDAVVTDLKLLLTKKQINDFKKGVEVKGNTLVITRMYISERGYIKMSVGIGKGKKNYDKRADIKTRDIERDNRFE